MKKHIVTMYNYTITPVQQADGKWGTVVKRTAANVIPHDDPIWTKLTFKTREEAMDYTAGQVSHWVLSIAALYPFRERAAIIGARGF